MLYWNLHQFLVQVSKLIPVTIPGGGQHNLYSRDSISLWCLFDSWEAVFAFILSKAKIWVFLFCFFVLELHCFILSSKPWLLLKGIFLLKSNLFCLLCQTFFPWNTCAAHLGTALPGHFGSSVQPPALTTPGAHKGAGRATTVPHPEDTPVGGHLLALPLQWEVRGCCAGGWQRD